MNWLINRLKEKSTWVVLVGGASLVLRSQFPEAQPVCDVVLGCTGVYEFGRSE